MQFELSKTSVFQCQLQKAKNGFLKQGQCNTQGEGRGKEKQVGRGMKLRTLS